MTTRQPTPERAIQFVTKLAQGFTAVLSFPEFIEYLMVSLKDDVGFESCTIALVDERRPNILTVVGATGLHRACRGLDIPRPDGFNWLVMETRQRLSIPDTHEDPRQFRRYDDVRSAMFAPLIVQDRIVGVLGAHAGPVNAFGADDLALLAVVAGYMASAVEVARLHQASLNLAVTDSVTMLPNRRHFLAALDRELSRSQRSGAPLSLVLLDLDGFKMLNDTYGHLEGDTVLARLAAGLRCQLRRSDSLARFGGDEFAVLFPETGPTGVRTILERVSAITVAVGPGGPDASVSVSWGSASSPTDATDAPVLLGIADARLYEMKRAKRAPSLP